MPDDEIQGGQVAPEATVTPEVNPESAQDSQEKQAEPQSTDTAAEDGDKDKPAERTFTQAELDEILAKKTAKLTRIRDQERSRREQLEQELARAAIPKDEGRPSRDQFSDEEAYADAVADWKLGLRDREEQVIKKVQSHATMESKAADVMAEVMEMEGFDPVKFATEVPITESMMKAIVDSDMGAKVTQHLYLHPDEARRIASLIPERQAAEIGKMEAKLSSIPKVSSAPAPITPISAGKASSAKSPESMTHEEYRAWRAKQGARWAR